MEAFVIKSLFTILMITLVTTSVVTERLHIENKNGKKHVPFTEVLAYTIWRKKYQCTNEGKQSYVHSLFKHLHCTWFQSSGDGLKYNFLLVK